MSKTPVTPATPPNHPTPAERRWELNYAIVERYIREFKALPQNETMFNGIAIGRWYHYQLSRSELGLLTSSQQVKLDALEHVLSEVLPPRDILGFEMYQPDRRRPIVPSPKNKKVAPQPATPKVPVDAVTARPATDSVSDAAERKEPASVPGPEHTAVDQGPGADTVEPVPAEVPAVSVDPSGGDEPEKRAADAAAEPVPAASEDTGSTVDDTTPGTSPADTSGAVEETEEQEPEEAPVTDTSTVDASPLRELIDATTDFLNTHGHMPRKANRDIVVAGRRLPDWTWTLVPAINNGTLSDEDRAELETAPWWGLILERAEKQKRRAAIIAAKKSAPVTDTPTPTSDTPVDAAEPAATSSKRGRKAIPEELKVRKPYTKDRPHRRNPLSRQAAEERAAEQRAKDDSITVDQLPEVGLADIAVTAGTADRERTYFIRAYREGLDLDQVTKAVTYLSKFGIGGRAQRHSRGFELRVAFHALDAAEAVNRLVALGYTIYSVSSTAGFPIEG